MPNEIISEYLNQPCPNELTAEDWLKLSTVFPQLNEQRRSILQKALTAHSGVASADIDSAFKSLSSSISQQNQNLFINPLLQAQERATLAVESFQQRNAIKKINTESLDVTRAEWLAIIARFEYQKGKYVTPLFFLHSLSLVRKVSVDSLTLTSSRALPARRVKKQKDHADDGNAAKRWRPDYIEDNGNNPIILETRDENVDLQAKLLETGVRSAVLTPASPESGYIDTARTPGNTKVRPLCFIEKNRFFKPITPIGNKQSRGRIDLSDASNQRLINALPRLLSDRTESIEFIATLQSMNERSGVHRGQSQKSIMKATCAEVFQASGIEIRPTDRRAHHWSHLIGYFLGGAQDYVNLIPATAAANYNTLEAIELFIQKQLIQKKTDQIKIKVDPKYSGESLIPDMLVYTLNWTGIQNKPHEEVFYINPRSYQRITKSMHESIAILRNEGEENTPPVSMNL